MLITFVFEADCSIYTIYLKEKFYGLQRYDHKVKKKNYQIILIIICCHCMSHAIVLYHYKCVIQRVLMCIQKRTTSYDVSVLSEGDVSYWWILL